MPQPDKFLEALGVLEGAKKSEAKGPDVVGALIGPEAPAGDTSPSPYAVDPNPPPEAPSRAPEKGKPSASMLETAKDLLARRFVGGPEAAASIASGIGSGLAARFAALPMKAVLGEPEAARRAAAIERAGTYRPRTEAGQSELEQFGRMFDTSKLGGLGPPEAMALSNVLAGPSRAATRQPVAAPPQAGVLSEADRVLAESRKLGLVVPPSSAPTSGIVGNAAEGLVARSAATGRVASVKNARILNQEIKSDLGLPKEVTEKTFEDMRKVEGAAYDAVKKSDVKITPNEKFQQALGRIKSSDYQQAAAEYGEEAGLSNESVQKLTSAMNKEVSPTAAVEMVKELRRRATKNLKSWDDLEAQDLGHAQRHAANALDDLIAENLDAAGKGELAANYRKARVNIAKLHDAEAAWDGTNFSSKELAKMQGKGVPLTGSMKQAADFARHFPDAAQDVTKMKGKAGFSQGDLIIPTIAAGLSGQPYAMAGVVAPWLTQRALLSKTGQRMLVPLRDIGAETKNVSYMDPMARSAIQSAAMQRQPNRDYQLRNVAP